MNGRRRTKGSDRLGEWGVALRDFEDEVLIVTGTEMKFAVDARQRWCSPHLMRLCKRYR